MLKKNITAELKLPSTYQNGLDCIFSAIFHLPKRVGTAMKGWFLLLLMEIYRDIVCLRSVLGEMTYFATMGYSLLTIGVLVNVWFTVFLRLVSLPFISLLSLPCFYLLV